jgi:hypothetical protein
MWWYDPEASSRDRECQEAGQFRRIAHESILAFLTDSTTPGQYEQALASLATLKADHVRRLDEFHRSPLYGRHRCIPEAALDLETRLRGAILLAPVPKPDPAPEPAPNPAPEQAPPAPLMTPLDVVKALRNRMQPQQDATPLGFDDDMPNLEQPK